MWSKVFTIFRGLLPFLKDIFKHRPKLARTVSLLSLGFLVSLALNLYFTFSVGNQSFNNINGVGIIGSTVSPRIGDLNSLYQQIDQRSATITSNPGDDPSAAGGSVAGIDAKGNVTIATGPGSTAIGSITTGDVITIIDQAQKIIALSSAISTQSDTTETINLNETTNSIIESASDIVEIANTLQFLDCPNVPIQPVSFNDKTTVPRSPFFAGIGLFSVPAAPKELVFALSNLELEAPYTRSSVQAPLEEENGSDNVAPGGSKNWRPCGGDDPCPVEDTSLSD